MAVRIVSLTAKLGMDGSSFQQGLSRAQRQAEQFGASLKSQLAGAFSATVISAGIRKIVSEVERIRDAADQFSITTDEVQRLDAAAKMSGQTFEDVGSAIERLGAARKRAAEGDSELRSLFMKFGVSLEQLNDEGLRNIDLMHRMATAIRGMNLSAADAQALRELFGKSGARLAAVLRDLQDVTIQPIKPADLAAIDEASNKLERLKQELIAIGATGMGDALGTGAQSDAERAKRLGSLAANPIGTVAVGAAKSIFERLRDQLFPATASNPRARSTEMVGPGTAPAGPLFEDKAAAAERAREAKAASEARFHFQEQLEFEAQKQLEKLQALGKKTNLLQGLNVGNIGRMGGFGGVSAERGFALLGGKDRAAEDLKKNTAQTVAELRALRNDIRKSGGDDLDF